MKTKILCIILISLFLGSTIIPSITSSSIDNKLISLDEDTKCFGFIVPIVKLENKTLENDIDCRIYHMINDFLREKITVYWSAKNFSISIMKIDILEEETMFFEKGTFIIPLTENDTINTKICAIICDYNQTSEIESDSVSIPVYRLMNSLEIKAHELTEIKISRYVGVKTHSTQFYLFVAMDCGFLDFDIVNANEIKDRLTNEKFNVIVWPGAESMKDKLWSYHIEAQIEEIKYQVMPTIREFVANGGGYVGSCYGTCKSSIAYVGQGSILKYKIIIPTIGIGGLVVIPQKNESEKPTDSIDDYFCNQTVINASHPVTYGLNQIVKDFSSLHGLRVVGSKAQVLAVYPDKTPCWVSNVYKNGKVISFGSHPEIAAFLEEGFNGRQVVSNTWYHLTNKGIFDLLFTKSVDLSVIDSIFEDTINLINSSIQPAQLFDEVNNNINKSISNLNLLKSEILDIQSIVNQLDNNNSETSKMNKTIRRILGGKYISGGINLSEYYLKKIPGILFSIQRIYPLLENELNITEETDLFIQNMILKINYFKNLTLNAKDDAEKAKASLVKYQNNNWFMTKIKQFYINEMLFKSMEKTSELLVRIFQTYNEALKFLRHYWYDYETQIEI